MEKHKTISIVCTMILSCLFFASCNNGQNPSELTTSADAQTGVASTPQTSPQDAGPQLTFAEVAGTYQSIGEDGNFDSRMCLFEDGTATWCMIGSLVISEYTYSIKGNKIYMTNKEFPDGETECWEFDPETHFLKDEEGLPTYYPEEVD